MPRDVILRGLTWDHPRACDGLFSETRRFNALDNGISIRWDAQPLRGFEATPIAQTAATYDLIILDHPFMGDAARGGALVDLRAHLAPDALATLQTSYVGKSFESYDYGGGLWALPIDAASQVAAFRPDLMDGPVPKTFAEVTELGERGGLGLSLANPHAFMAYLGIAACLGADIAGTGARLVPPEIGLQALTILRGWARLVPDEAFGQSSIGLLEAMATTSRVSYCPMVFAFNTYAQAPAQGRHRLGFGDIPTLTGPPTPQRPVLGGTGLAISASTPDIPAALAAVLHFTGEAAQLRMAADGGQPAHRAVWSPTAAPTRNGSFFTDCAPAQTAAVLRPRWPDYIGLQNGAGELLRDDLLAQDKPALRTVEAVEEMFRTSRP